MKLAIIQINNWILFAMTLFMSVFERMVSPLIILLAIGALIEYLLSDGKAEWNKGMTFSVTFFTLIALGMFYTENTVKGLDNLGVRASFIILPCIFFLLSKKSDQKRMSFALWGLITGAVAGAMICWGWQLTNLVFGEESFGYTSFSILLHPTYFSVNLIVAITILFYHSFLSGKSLAPIIKVFNSLVMLFLVITVFITSAKMALVSMLVILSTFLFLLVFRRHKLVAICSLVLILLFSGLTVRFNPRLWNGVQQAMNIDWNTNIVYGTVHGRVFVWRQSTEVLKRNPIMGVGTGDVADEVFNNYKDEEIRFMDDFKLNCHNQFLQNYLEIGIIGLVASLFLILHLLIFRERHLLFSAIAIILFINFLTESMLNRQAGVVLTALFIQLYWLRASRNIAITSPMDKNVNRKPTTERIPGSGN